MSNDNVTHWVDIRMKRGPSSGELKSIVGLRMTITTNPDLETFMQKMSGSAERDVTDYDMQWAPTGDNPLKVYNTDGKFQPSTVYTVEYPGSALLIPQNRPARNRLDPEMLNPVGGNELVNLSFLRLVGVGKPGGVTIGISGAISREYAIRTKQLILSAAEQFLKDYVTPIDINLQIYSRNG